MRMGVPRATFWAVDAFIDPLAMALILRRFPLRAGALAHAIYAILARL
jgi:hypothetical protein